MGTIDVTDLLADPDFVDSMTVITRYPIINSLGENILRETRFDTVGSIQPADYEEIQKVPDALRVANMMVFYFKGKIDTSSPGKYSSVLVFQGQRYQIKTVADYSNWGAGYSEGTCVAEVPAP